MAQNTGWLARLFSSSKEKKKLCCGVELEDINDAPEAALDQQAPRIVKTDATRTVGSGQDIGRPSGR
jgi:hypothetical protein